MMDDINGRNFTINGCQTTDPAELVGLEKVKINSWLVIWNMNLIVPSILFLSSSQLTNSYDRCSV